MESHTLTRLCALPSPPPYPSSRSASRIILARHGRSALVHRGGWLSSAGVQRQRDAYDAAGIAADDVPPRALVGEIGPNGIVVASDLPRAIESAERLAPGEPIPVSPLLRETPLEIPTKLPLRMPLAGWEALMHARWTLQIANGSDASPKDLTRAHAAADWLVSMSRDHSPVIAITHGVFRRLLADRLMTMGWRSDLARRSYDHWSAWSFERDG